MDIDKPSVAIYWDFENIHATLIDQLRGAGIYRQTRFSPQEPVVNVGALMEFCASFGAVAINRAYGNWQWFSRYREALLHNAVELIQLFPPGAAAEKVDQDEESEPSRPEAIELIRRAISRLAANSGEPWVLKAAIRPMVLRLDPTFDEKSYGATTFSALLKKHGDVLEMRKGRFDQEYRLKTADSPNQTEA